MRITLYYNLYSGRIMASLGAVVALSAFIYGGLLLMAVGHAASASTAKEEIRDLRTTLGQLEGVYLTQTRSLTAEHARELGFTSPVATDVVYAGTAVLSVRTR